MKRLTADNLDTTLHDGRAADARISDLNATDIRILRATWTPHLAVASLADLSGAHSSSVSSTLSHAMHLKIITRKRGGRRPGHRGPTPYVYSRLDSELWAAIDDPNRPLPPSVRQPKDTPEQPCNDPGKPRHPGIFPAECASHFNVSPLAIVPVVHAFSRRFGRPLPAWTWEDIYAARQILKGLAENSTVLRAVETIREAA